MDKEEQTADTARLRLGIRLRPREEGGSVSVAQAASSQRSKEATFRRCSTRLALLQLWKIFR